ncbi:MAG: sialidase family protein [Myxococcales bacterium]
MRSKLAAGLALALGCALACCTKAGGPDGGTTGGTTGRRPSGGSTGSGGSCDAGSGTLGAACVSDCDCAAGLGCITQVPNGYCSAACSVTTACPLSDGTCVEPLPGQFACGLSCKSDSDCTRADIPFVCDPTCQVCVPSFTKGQVSCAPHFAGAGGNDAGAPCGTLPDAGALAWSASVAASESAGSLSEAEGALATDDAGTIVVGFMVNPGEDAGATNALGVALSHDDGATFTVLPPIAGPDSQAFDPSLAVASNGTFYCAFAGLYVDSAGATNGHVYLMTSDGGSTWSAPVSISSPQDIPSGGGIDKPFVAVNPATQAPNTVFCSFTGTYDKANSGYGIRLVAGTTPSTSQPDIDLYAGSRGALRDLPSIAFDAKGNGYAVWAETTDQNQVVEDQITGTEIAGTDAGSIWFAYVYLDPSSQQPVPPPMDFQVSAPTDQVVFDVPRVAVAPDGSVVYAVYVVGNANATDIAVAVGTGAGSSWTPPVIVNDDPGCATHFHPAVYLDASGALWVTWVSNRDGDGRVYYAVSTDGAQKFSASAPVSDQPFYFTTLDATPAWLGGYQSLLFGNGELYSLWSGAVGGTSPQSPSHVYFQKAALP